jgi:hypothetical protein
MKPWRGKRPQTNCRKLSQRVFPISRFWWLLTPFFMTRQNQKPFLLRNASNSPIFAEPNLSATSSLVLMVDRGQRGCPQIGQYTVEVSQCRGAPRLPLVPRTTRQHPTASTFSPSPRRAATLVNCRPRVPAETMAFSFLHAGSADTGRSPQQNR